MSEELTFKEIAQIALGSVDFNNVQISLLYTIIDLLLKKLNCEDEKVTLTGIAAEKLEELLSVSGSAPPMAFRDNRIKMPIKTFDSLDDLEKKIEQLENGLEGHLTHMKNFKDFYNEASSTGVDGSSNIMPCTLYCDIDEPKSEIVAKLLRSEWFYNLLNKFLTTPFSSRLRVIELKAEKLQQDIEEFKTDCTLALERIDKSENVFVDLLAIKALIKDNHAEFLSTVKEIQEVMDMKVDNLDAIPLKRSLQSIIKRIAYEIFYLKHLQTKPRALLCITHPIETGKFAKSIVERFEKSQKFRDIPCGCDEASLHGHLVERLDHIDTTNVKRRSASDIDDKWEKFKEAV